MNECTNFDRRPKSLQGETVPCSVPFTKMEGAGNDYIYVEEFDAPLPNPAALSVRMSDRNFGIGGDGLVLMGPSGKADFRMRIFNSDGSEAEMCGNASRCVGKYLYEHGFTAKTEISLETLAGIKVLHLTVSEGVVSSITADMGLPILVPADIPMSISEDMFVAQPLTVCGQQWQGTAVSMGNPHLVIPVPDVCQLDLPLIGPQFENMSIFPKRVNTEFVQVLTKDRVRVRVWERGAGETLACGTGACATLVACALNSLTDRGATIELRGGNLFIEWASSGTVYMTGPAVEVFSGVFACR